MVWGCQPWIGFPYANYAYQFNFQPGQSGKLILEFWITPFDYAPYSGPENAKVKDESIGDINAWKWDFGDGTISHEQNPIHRFKQPGVRKVITLEVSGPEGVSRRTRYWEVMIK